MATITKIHKVRSNSIAFVIINLHVTKTIKARNINSEKVELLKGPSFFSTYGHIIWIGMKNCKENVKHIPKPTANFTTFASLK